MSTVKISELPAASGATGADVLPIVQGGVTKRIAFNGNDGPALREGGIVKNPQVSLQDGLQFAANNNLPEYPDGVAGTAYLGKNFTATTGWSAPLGGTISVLNGDLLLNNPATGAKIFRYTASGIVGKTARVKIKLSAAGSVNINNDGTHYSKTLAPNEYTYIDAYLDGAANALDIEFSVIAIATVNFVYIGDGTYDTLLLDQSGNGNHATPYGVTATGGELIFHGVNDYIQSQKPNISLTALTVRSRVKWSTATSVQIVSIADSGSTRVFRLGSGAVAAGRIDFRVSGDGSTLVNVTSPNSVNDGLWHDIVGVYIGGTSLQLYIDGTLVNTNTTSIPASLFSGSSFMHMGRVEGTGYTAHTSSTPLIYNRALSAAEIFELYRNADGFTPANAVVAVTPVPYSIPQRDANGNGGFNGIKFPATQFASSDPNTLDDYEEGTFASGVSFGGASVGVTYTVQTGRYTKIGNKVFFDIFIILSNKGSSVGNATITGLPFTSSSAANQYASITIGTISAITFSNIPTAWISPGATSIVLFETTTAGVRSAITNADFANNSEIMLSGAYTV